MQARCAQFLSYPQKYRRSFHYDRSIERMEIGTTTPKLSWRRVAPEEQRPDGRLGRNDVGCRKLLILGHGVFGPRLIVTEFRRKQRGDLRGDLDTGPGV